jgi:hypothetical protein
MNPHAIATHAHVAWIRFGVIRPVGVFQAEPESAGIEIRGRNGIGNVEKRNGVLKQYAPLSDRFHPTGTELSCISGFEPQINPAKPVRCFSLEAEPLGN